jgi:iron complex outermembrane recepter protein
MSLFTVRGAVRAALWSSLTLAPGLALAASDDTTLEEIVVTAQFREESLQETPLAISAFSGENLEVKGLTNVTDLDAFVPNTVIQPLGAGWGSTLAAFIRGVGLGDNILSFEPGVPIYVDDVYMGRPQGAIFDLLDLERVEVLRGPQGTLFGKNAIGGTVRLISKKPRGEGDGSLQLTVGSRNRIDARGSFDTTLVPDRVFARFSVSSKRADGYFKVLDYECVNGAGSLGAGGAGIAGFPGVRLGTLVSPGQSCTVDTLGDENVHSARAALRFVFSDTTEFNLIGDVTDQRQKGPADKYTIIDGTNGLNGFWSGTFAAPVYGAGIAYDDRFVTDSPYTNYSRYDDPHNQRDYPNINNLNHWGVSGTLEWKLAENVSLTSITAYRQFWNIFGRDSDGSPLFIDATYDENRHRQFTQELRLTGTASQLDWALGAFYYDAHDSNRGHSSLYPSIISQQDALDRQDTENWAVFAHGTFHATEQFSVTGGLRYTDDQKDATIYRAGYDGTIAINNQFVPLSAKKTDYTISLDYQWSDTFMTYAKYATGFKGGGFSPRPSTPVQTEPFDPEKLKTFELGAKSELADRRVRLNGALFISDYVNQQSFAQQCEPGTGGPGQPACINWFREINAGKSRIWGLEGELLAEPVDDLQIEASFGYLNYKLTSNDGNTLLFEGDECGGSRCYAPRTPKLTGGLGIQYSYDALGGRLTPRLDLTYQSKIYFTQNNGCPAPSSTPLPGCGTIGAQGNLTLLNGRVSWMASEGDWEVSLYGRNLTDKAYFNGKLSLVGFFGREQGNVAAPREFGVTVRRHF